jgi:hypothetical protein
MDTGCAHASESVLVGLHHEYSYMDAPGLPSFRFMTAGREDCTRTSGLSLRHEPLSLMGFAGWLLNRFVALQVVLTVEPPHALVVDRVAFADEQVVDAPVAEASPLMGELDDACAQLDGSGVGARGLAVAGPGQPHKAAGPAFADAHSVEHLAHRRAPRLWG